MKSGEIFEYAQQDADAHTKATEAFHRLGNYVYSGKGPDFEVKLTANGEKGPYWGVRPNSIDFGFDDICVLVGMRYIDTSIMAGAIWNFASPLDGKYRKALVVHAMRNFSEDNFRSSINSTAFISTFVHEYTHLMDYARTADAMKKTYSDASDRGKYYNDPAEFNAFYHTYVSGWLSILRDIQKNPADAKDLMDIFNFTGDFKSDMQYVMRTSEHSLNFFKHLSERNRKRIVQRMFQLHQAILKASKTVAPS